MKGFHFPLEKALEWRRQQLELEPNRFKSQTAALAQLDRARAELEAAGIRAEVQVRAWAPLAGQDLAALSRFREHVAQEERSLEARRSTCRLQLEAQQKRMLEARRRSRLLEQLRERRWEEWRAASDRELEGFAAECYLAGVARHRG